MPKLLNKVKQPLQDTSKLSYIFRQEPNLAWDMIEQECNIYTNSNIGVEAINNLNSIYCPYLQKIVLRLNELQDPRQKYFNNKMQKLMAEPFIIRCYNQCSQQQKSTNTNLNQKRRELEQKLSIENEKQHNHAFQHIIQSQNEKEKKLMEKIEEVIEDHEKKLESRLKLRSIRKMTSPMKKNSQDSILSSSQFRNPENTPTKNSNPFELDIKQLMSPQNPYTRPLSERTFNYKFSKVSIEESSDSSEDEYQIEKRLRESHLERPTKSHPHQNLNTPK